MSKPKQKHLQLSFETATGSGIGFAVKQNVLKNLSEKSLRFFHFERKGNTDLVLDAMKAEEPVKEILIKRPKKGPAILVFGNEEVEVSKYTVISLGEDRFLYYLDELPDGTWRICHSDSMFPINQNGAEHKDIVKIHLHEVIY